MKLYLANYEPDRLGGGWTFANNFIKALGEHITHDYNEADIYFITSPSMVQREEVLKAKEDKKKIVLRIDNAVRNSRNRNTGMTRMKDFADWADLIVYQSNWARKYLLPFTQRDGVVIHNSVDTSIFNPIGRDPQDHFTYIYSRYNRDETKGLEIARYYFHKRWRQDRSAECWFVGQFSPEVIEGNFDFYMNEPYQFLGVLPNNEMAAVYKKAHYLIYTYFNDACSNTLIEALCCGLQVSGYEFFIKTGGAPEILERFEHPHKFNDGLEYFGLNRMGRQYLEAIGKLGRF